MRLEEWPMIPALGTDWPNPARFHAQPILPDLLPGVGVVRNTPNSQAGSSLGSCLLCTPEMGILASGSFCNPHGDVSSVFPPSALHSSHYRHTA